MKKLLVLFLCLLPLTGCSLLSNINWDAEELEKAKMSALTAVSISDAQVIALSQQTVAQMDAKNVVDNGKYKQRLDKLMKGVTDINGIAVNYKVYKLDEINAFACGDGSIRVYSGLMDVMNDDELIAIIGHECGHVAAQDSKRAMKNAYLAASARGVLNAAGGTIGSLSKTALGDLGESFVSSQFSQKQEYAADEYGFNFAIKQGHDKYSMYNALNKLVELSGGTKASLVQNMFSSHPGSAERAAKMKTKADSYK